VLEQRLAQMEHIGDHIVFDEEVMRHEPVEEERLDMEEHLDFVHIQEVGRQE
jgi:hypothetical protein